MPTVAPSPTTADDNRRPTNVGWSVIRVWIRIWIRTWTTRVISSGWTLHRVTMCIHALCVTGVVALLEVRSRILSTVRPCRSAHQRPCRATDRRTSAHLATERSECGPDARSHRGSYYRRANRVVRSGLRSRSAAGLAGGKLPTNHVFLLEGRKILTSSGQRHDPGS